jgi:hypothetical protein
VTFCNSNKSNQNSPGANLAYLELKKIRFNHVKKKSHDFHHGINVTTTYSEVIQNVVMGKMMEERLISIKGPVKQKLTLNGYGK